MDVDTVSTLIGNMGFPIFVAIFMLTKGQKENEMTREAINKLTIAVNKIGGGTHE